MLVYLEKLKLKNLKIQLFDRKYLLTTVCAPQILDKDMSL
jgi:hypothetical protein